MGTEQSPSNKPHPLHTPVLQVLDLVDADYPVLSGVGLLQYVQFKVLVAYLCITDPVIATGLACNEDQVNVM